MRCRHEARLRSAPRVLGLGQQFAGVVEEVRALGDARHREEPAPLASRVADVEGVRVALEEALGPGGDGWIHNSR